MEITPNRFQEVILGSQINLENQIYNAALDTAPKSAWQSFVNWLNNLLYNDNQFDMVNLSRNISDLITKLDPNFFNEIDPDQIQIGIHNLQALRTKFSNNREKGLTTSNYLDPVIHNLQNIHENKLSTLKNERLNKLVLDFFSGEQSKGAFAKNFPLEARRYNDNCISYFGFETLKDIFNEHVVKAKINNPEYLFRMATIRKEELVAFNQKTMKEIKTHFVDPQNILPLFFPAFSNQLPELELELKEGRLFFAIEHKNLLDEVIHNPESVQRRLQNNRNTNFPAISDEPEQRRILGKLLELRKA